MELTPAGHIIRARSFIHKMSKAHFFLKSGGTESKVIVEGHDITSVVSAVKISMRTDGTPEIELELLISECQVDSDGMVKLNCCSIPDNLGRQFYSMLKKRFEDNAGDLVTEEREACAKVCEKMTPWGNSADDWAAECLRSAAKAIRARLKK